MFHSIDFSVKREDLFCKALTTLPQSILMLADDLRIVYTNKRCEEMLCNNEVVGKYIWEILPSFKQEGTLQVFDQAFRENDTITLTKHHEVLNGEDIWWDLSISSLQHPLNNIFYSLMTFQNVTEKVQLEKQIDQSHKLERVFQNVGGPMAVFDHKGDKVFSNHAYSRLFEEGHDLLSVEDGFKPTTLEKLQQVFDFYDFKGRKWEVNQLPIQNILDGEQIHNCELKLYHRKRKNTTYFLCNTNQVETEELHQPYIVLMMTDVSKELGDEQNRRDFIQIAAHELRTPLTSIKGFTQLVLERYKERGKKWFFQPTMRLVQEIERDQTFFKVILEEAVRLDDLTNELLSIFRIDEGKFQMDMQSHDFSLIVQEAIQEFMIPNDFHRIHYTDLTDATTSNVLIDKKQIKRVIHNLLSNAIKYSPSHGEVHVTLESHQGYVQLSVIDQGIGIPIEQQNRIFQRFFRVHSEEHEGIHGFGVGLHICEEIVRQHKGQMSFKSTFGQGSTFYFQLPELT